MKIPLTDDLRRALAMHPDGIEVEDPETNRVYFLADAETHRNATAAGQQQQDRAAIQAGIADMEAGRVVPFADVDARIRATLGLPPRAP